MLPPDLQTDIQQFSESDYAKQYFSTHKSGFFFRRRVPVAQLMTWQKVSLISVSMDTLDADSRFNTSHR